MKDFFDFLSAIRGAVLIMFFIFVVFCRAEFKALADRVLEFGPGGIKLNPRILPQQVVEPAEVKAGVVEKKDQSATPVNIGETIPRISVNGVALPQVIVFPEGMKIAKTETRKELEGLNEQESIAYLVERVAWLKCLYEFEFCYSTIFGGQIRLLQALNQRADFVMPMWEVIRLWQSHQLAQKPLFDDWKLEQYLNFLTQKQFIVATNESVSLTMKGLEFVRWMTHFSKPLEKAF